MNNEAHKIIKLKDKIKHIENKKLNKSKPKKQSNASFGFKISTELISALVVGVGIGLIVDKYLGTKPFGLIIFFIFGAFAGILNIYRVMRRIEKQ
jgi:ATP synthase protein I